MTTKKALVVGCSAVAGVALLVVLGIVLFITYVAKDVEGLQISITSPPEIKIGDTFDLQVSVTNGRASKPLKVSDVDIAEGYLSAFVLVSTSPDHKSSMRVPVDK